MSVENIAVLKKEVERVFGKRILSTSDCQCLSVDIYQQTELKISVNTLRRIFNLMKSKYQPSLFTLDLLSKYCRFASYSDFISPVNEKVTANQNLEMRFLNLLTFLFRDMDIKGMNEITYKHLIYEIIVNLDQCNPHLADRFHQQIANTLNGQKYYFEQFINIDELNKSYGRGLSYYLHEKNTDEAKLFVHSLLCLNSWLTMNKQGVKTHCHEVLYLAHKYDSNDEAIDPFIKARIFSAQLFSANVSHAEIKPILIQARKCYDRKKSFSISRKFPSFEYVLAETLVLINEYEEALFYIEEAIKNGKHDLHAPHNDLRFLESLYLFKAIALASMGEMQKSKYILERVSIANFHFLARKFNLILYLLLKQRFEKGQDLREQILFFVKQTGFKKLIIKQMEYVEGIYEHVQALR